VEEEPHITGAPGMIEYTFETPKPGTLYHVDSCSVSFTHARAWAPNSGTTTTVKIAISD